MINQQLTDWAKEQLRQGTSKDDVRQMLKNTGWQDNDIDQMFLEINTPPSSGVPIPHRTESKLIGVRDLFGETLSVYKDRFWSLFGIYLLSGIAIIIPIGIVTALSIFGGQGLPLRIIIFILFLVILVFAVFGVAWMQGAIIYTIKDRGEKIGIKESFRRSKHFPVPMIWLGFVTSFVVLGGTMLLIIPGILFWVWFSFGTYVLASENLRGMDALMKSKEYARGKWWAIFGRLLFIQFMLYVAVYLIPWAIKPFSATLSNIVAIVIAILSVPVLYIYMFLMYENLRDIKSANVVATSKKGVFIFLAWLGVLVIPILIMGSVLLSLNSARGAGRDTQRAADINIISTGAEFYYNDKQHYPASLGELVPYINGKPIPVDPTTGLPYKYTLLPDGSDFVLCYTNNTGAEKCSTKNGPLP